MPDKLQLYGLYVYYVVHICDFGMLRVNSILYSRGGGVPRGIAHMWPCTTKKKIARYGLLVKVKILKEEILSFKNDIYM